MREYISINQKAFSKFKNVDLIDATIFEYIYKFAISNNAEKQLIDNKLFFWVSYQKIIDDNPLIKISDKDTIARRVKKLLNYGLLEKFTDRKNNNKTYFNITQFAYEFLINGNIDLPSEKSEAPVSKVGNLPSEKSDNSKLYYRELIDKEKRNKKTTTSTSKVIEDYLNLLEKYKPNSKDSLRRIKVENEIISALRKIDANRLLELVEKMLNSNNKFLKGKAFNIKYIADNFLELEMQLEETNEDLGWM